MVLCPAELVPVVCQYCSHFRFVFRIKQQHIIVQHRCGCLCLWLLWRVQPAKSTTACRYALPTPDYVLVFLRTGGRYRVSQRCIRGQTCHIYSKDVKEIQIPIPARDKMESLAAIIEAMKDGLKKRGEFEKANAEATRAFLQYINAESRSEQNSREAQSVD